MSGSDFVFNYAKGREVYYAGLPASADSLVALLLVNAGLSADETLNNDATLAAVLTHGTECTGSGYSRATMGTVTITQEDAPGSNDNLVTVPNFNFGSIASGSTIAKLVICYNPDTGANGALGIGHESSLIPLVAYNYDAVTDGTQIAAVVGTGIFKAA